MSLNKGTIGLFAICEVTKDRLIVNHTRNTKGYVSLKSDEHKHFTVGQFIVASVLEESGARMLKSGKVNRKVQLTMDSKIVNKALTSETTTKGMLLQATVKSLESKGYVLGLGFKDKSTGFMKF